MPEKKAREKKAPPQIKAYKTQLRTKASTGEQYRQEDLSQEDRSQEDLSDAFRRWAGCARYVYNWALDRRIEHYQETGETLSAYEQDKAVTQLKKDEDHEWLGEPPRRVLYYAIQDLDAAFQHFFRRVEEGGEAPGFPRFKAKHRSRTSFSVYGSDCRYETGRIRLPKIGWVPLEEKGYIPEDAEKYGRVTVSRQVDKWYVSVAVHEEKEPLPEGKEISQTAALAVHPGVNKWIELSSGADEEESLLEISPEESLLEISPLELPSERMSTLQGRLRREQKSLSRKEQGSHNYARQRRRVEAVHRKIRNLRKNATHQATAYICYTLRPETLVYQKYDVRSMLTEVFEDLPVSVARRIKFGIANANMGELLRQLRYKAEWAGIETVEVDRGVPVSERCHRCGERHTELGLQRTFDCPNCSLVTGREKNAVQNLLIEMQKALDSNDK